MPAFGLSINDARRAIGIGRTKLYDLINAGEIDVFKIGRRTLIPKASVGSSMRCLQPGLFLGKSTEGRLI
ncbi:helix-turn-helix domain-containing protein [Sphingomonas sp. MMS24-JH45]